MGLYLLYVCSEENWHMLFTSLNITPFPKAVKLMGRTVYIKFRPSQL